MTDNFWKLIACSAVAGILYVGHGLHQQAEPVLFPSFSKSALAEGIAVESGRIYTVSPDGREIHNWVLTGNRLLYVSSATVPENVK